MSNAVPVPAKIKAIATHLPDYILTNDELSSLFDDWTAEKIEQKTGIRTRRIAGPHETAADLGFAAAERLFASNDVNRDEVDYLIFCSQAADYILPTTACLLQHRLNLRRDVGALDITLGCSGFVYSLSLAVGLIAAGMASNILLITADTYSKFINPRDKSVRTLFGDGAAACLITRPDLHDGCHIGHFVFGTDGSGGDDLIVKTGGARYPKTAQSAIEFTDGSGNVRSEDNLYMNGGAVMNFTLREVPTMFSGLKSSTGYQTADFDFVIMHQANMFMLEALRKKMKLSHEQTPYFLDSIGNTVSSTIPFVIDNLIRNERLTKGTTAALLGFGVGLSWAGCVIQF